MDLNKGLPACGLSNKKAIPIKSLVDFVAGILSDFQEPLALGVVQRFGTVTPLFLSLEGWDSNPRSQGTLDTGSRHGSVLLHLQESPTPSAAMCYMPRFPCFHLPCKKLGELQRRRRRRRSPGSKLFARVKLAY